MSDHDLERRYRNALTELDAAATALAESLVDVGPVGRANDVTRVALFARLTMARSNFDHAPFMAFDLATKGSRDA